MKKKTVLVFVFEGMADWEVSYALVGINKSGAFDIKTIAFEKSPLKTMGGLTVVPDVDFIPKDLEDIEASNTALLILPGGDAWDEGKNSGLASLIYHCVESHIPIAAICGGAHFLARLGLLDKIKHTANDLEYLQTLVPEYSGQVLFQNQPSVLANGIITASGVSPLEFAADIFDSLGISDQEELKNWFRYFQNKMVDC